MIDVRVKTFLTVCSYMNFTHAAEKLHLTQPAVSQHIKYLEKYYGTTLFIREKRNLTLTPAGEILRHALEAMQNDESTIQKRIQESMTGQKTLTFGVTMTIGEYAVVPALARFIKQHPETNFHIRYGNTQVLLNALKNGSIDFAIVEGYFPTNYYHTRIYRTEEYVAVTAKNHNFAGPVRCLQDLTKECLLIRESGSGTREILTRMLALNNLSVSDFPHYVEVENIHTIVSLLKQDCGISFLYKTAVEKELQRGQLELIHLPDMKIQHDFTFLWNKGSIFSDEYERICTELQMG